MMGSLFRRGILLILLFISMSNMSYAQGMPYEETAELYFPNLISFYLGVELPGSEASNVTLQIEPESGAGLTVRFPQDMPLERTSDYFTATYDWNISENNPPAFLSSITYRWNITLTNGQQESIENTIQYVDERANWDPISSPGNIIHLTAPTGFTTSTTLARVEPVYNELAAISDLQIPISWLIYPDELTLFCNQDENGTIYVDRPVVGGIARLTCNETLARRSIETAGLNLKSIDQDQRELLTLMANWIFETFADAMWEDNPVPAWFENGLKRFFQPGGNPGSLLISRQILRAGRPFSLQEMQQLPENNSQVGAWEAQAFGMVLYLSEQIGIDALYEITRSTANGIPFNDAYTASDAVSPEVLIADWQSWIFSNRADEVYLYNPYLPITPTPTPSPTITPTIPPPTATASHTPTVEITASPTLSATPRPPTPTVTPLPAQSFTVRATPIPEATSNEVLPVGVNGAQILVLVVAGLLALIVLILFARRS